MFSSDEYGINRIIVREIEYGLAIRGSSRLRRQIKTILEVIAVFDLPSDIGTHYGQIRIALEKQGTTIGPNDFLIAAQALASDLTVVTGNEKEFQRVPNLRVENWIWASGPSPQTIQASFRLRTDRNWQPYTTGNFRWFETKPAITMTATALAEESVLEKAVVFSF